MKMFVYLSLTVPLVANALYHLGPCVGHCKVSSEYAIILCCARLLPWHVPISGYLWVTDVLSYSIELCLWWLKAESSFISDLYVRHMHNSIKTVSNGSIYITNRYGCFFIHALFHNMHNIACNIPDSHRRRWPGDTRHYIAERLLLRTRSPCSTNKVNSLGLLSY